MSQTDKLIQRFLINPESVQYAELEKILLHYGFTKKQAKGSHVKFKLSGARDVIIPVHENDCKNVYKKYVKTLIEKF